jgi:hypothetical protein
MSLGLSDGGIVLFHSQTARANTDVVSDSTELPSAMPCLA